MRFKLILYFSGNLFQVDDSETPISVFSFSERKDNQFKIHIMDIYSPRGGAGPPPLKISTEFSFPPEAQLDFPIFEYVNHIDVYETEIVSICLSVCCLPICINI